jgi:hypothetical protein
MRNRIVIPQNNICVVSFTKIYKERFIEGFLKNLQDYSIKNITFKNKDIRRLFVHNIIHSICEEILESRVNEKCIVYFSTTSLPHSFINDFVNEEEVLVFLEKLFNKIKKMLPVSILVTSNSFEYFCYLLDKNKAEGTELLYSMISIINSSNFDKFTFQKIKNFSKKYGLTFLSNMYFNDIKSKQLLIK